MSDVAVACQRVGDKGNHIKHNLQSNNGNEESLGQFLLLDEAIASGAVFVIVSGSDGQKRFGSQLNN